MDNREYINELFKHVKSDSILIIDRKGQLKRLYCPFPVEVVVPVGQMGKGLVVFVEAIKMTPDMKDVYVIEGKAYYLSFFAIRYNPLQ